MIPSSSVRTLVDVTCAALVLSASVACGAPAAVAPAAASATPRADTREPEPAPTAAAPEQPAAAPSAPADETAIDVVTLIAKPGLWPLDVEAARIVLRALGPVSHEQRSPNDLSLVGGPYGALDRFDITYSLDDEQYWVFGSAGFFLEDDHDAGHLYHTLEARLTELLGKPARTDRGESTTSPPVVWDLGEAWLSLAQSTDHGQVQIAIRENEHYARWAHTTEYDSAGTSE